MYKTRNVQLNHILLVSISVICFVSFVVRSAKRIYQDSGGFIGKYMEYESIYDTIENNEMNQASKGAGCNQ